MHSELEVATTLARRAGDLILEVRDGEFSPHTDVEEKAGGEGPVTIADRRADELIRTGLARQFPSDALLTEESPDDLARLRNRRVWVVDPLDGTRQFVQQGAEFAVMIGLSIDGRAVLGVVHLPCEQLTYVAAPDVGAAEIDAAGTRRALRLEPLPRDPGRLTVTVSRSHYNSRTRRVVEALGPADIVVSGSVGRKAALVATGRADVYVNLSSRSRHWDACAPEVIVREAGGAFRDTLGRELIYNTAATHNAHGLIACRAGLLARTVETTAAVLAALPR